MEPVVTCLPQEPNENGKACLRGGLVCFSPVYVFSVPRYTPRGSALAGLPLSDGGGGTSHEGERSAAQLATQASFLMALLTSRAALDTLLKSSKI